MTSHAGEVAEPLNKDPKPTPPVGISPRIAEVIRAFGAYSFGLVLTTTTAFATDEVITQYFILPPLHYVFREVDYTRSETGTAVHRLFAIDTNNPKAQSQVGSDLDGPGLGPDVFGCELSPDEQWLWVDFHAGHHTLVPMLFRHVSGVTFENKTSSSDVETALQNCYPDGEETRLLAWKKDSSGVYLTLLARGHVKGVFSYSAVLAFYSLITHRATVLSPAFSMPSGADVAAWLVERATQFRKVIGQGAVEEPSPDTALNLAYNLLRRRLNGEDQQQLVAEEKGWLVAREKKAASERGEFTAARVNALAERWLRVATQER